jgi:ABC-type transport system substrate-binding protein
MMNAPAAQGGPMFGGKFDLTIANIYSAAGPFAAQFFICSERAPNGFNISRICNPQIDRLFSDIIASNDPALRSRDTKAIERLLATALPQIPLMQGRILAAMSSRVHGIAPTPLTPYVGMENWSIDP